MAVAASRRAIMVYLHGEELSVDDLRVPVRFKGVRPSPLSYVAAIT